MGARPSKPRIRRRLHSLRKRQGPEGSNAPEPLHTETAVVSCSRDDIERFLREKVALVGEHEEMCCKFCQPTRTCCQLSPDGNALTEANDVVSGGWAGKIQTKPEGKSFSKEEFLPYSDLKVDLPPSYNQSQRCETPSPMRSSPTQIDTTKSTKKNEQEWTITLYEIDKLSGRVSREDMIRLISSIYDAVDTKIGEAPHGRKTVRVRLSVTPEPRSRHRIQRSHTAKDTTVTPATTSTAGNCGSCQCSECPNTAPPTRRITTGNTRVRRHRSDLSPSHLPHEINDRKSKQMLEQRLHHRLPQVNHFQDNRERRKQYSKFEAIENSKRQTKSNRNVPIDSDQQQLPLKSGYQKNNECKPNEKHASKNSHCKRRTRYNGLDQRSALLKTRGKDPRFASPYDQHFQEAMYLRLRELQRQGVFETRSCWREGVLDSDEADDDESDFENVLKPSSTNRVDEKLSSMKIDDNINETSTTTNIHHHYHHGVSSSSVLATLCTPKEDSKLQEGGGTNPFLPPPYYNSSDIPTSLFDSHQHHHFHHHYHHTDKT